MRFRKVDIVTQKRETLVKLQKKSTGAMNLITSTINKLSSVNDEIDITIADIEATKTELELTRQDLVATRTSNEKIANKFKQLIEA